MWRKAFLKSRLINYISRFYYNNIIIILLNIIYLKVS